MLGQASNSYSETKYFNFSRNKNATNRHKGTNDKMEAMARVVCCCPRGNEQIENYLEFTLGIGG